MSKFTQGKWYVDKCNNVVDEHDEDIAEVLYRAADDERDYPEEYIANARLIAAAPEMYRALEELIPILKDDGRLGIAYSIKKLLERIDGTDTEVKS